jgi:hypothetical protein
MIDFAVALTSLTKGLEALRAIQEIDKNLDAATYKAKIADLMNAVAEAKIALIDAREEIASRNKEIDRLKEGLQFRRENTIMLEGFRYEKGQNGKPVGMPFCRRCDTIDGILIQIAETCTKDGYKGICPNCKADYGSGRGCPYS